MSEVYLPNAMQNDRRKGMILTLEGRPGELLNEIRGLVLNRDDQEYLIFQVIEWFRTHTLEQMDVSTITNLVMEYIFKEMVNVIGHTMFETWYRHQGQILRIKLILFAMHLKERLLQYNLYGHTCIDQCTLPYGYLSSRGNDALLLAYVPSQ